ncbi:MAG: ABC transporter substrate-binding protein [Rhodospirillaceae bacterium]|nr:ABC transporter substrate-binding protein [Rhodospirillaceae bacterium]
MTALLAGTALVLALAGAARAESQGVTATEIVLGTHTSLTGPVAPWGIGSTNGARLRFDEENAKGGIYGRKIRLVVEDHGYQVPRAVQAGNKLLTSDKIFAMIVALGTPMNNAVLQRQLAMKVVNFGPFTAARSMAEPFNPLKFAVLSTYYQQTRIGLKYFVQKKGVKAPCVMYQDTEFGQEILEGAQDEAKALNIKIAATAGHKPTDTNFIGSITKLRDAKCDLVLMGTIVRDTIIPYATARKLGWNVPFVGTVASYEHIVASAQGGATDGYFAMTSQEVAYADTATGRAKDILDAYKAKYGQDAPFPAQLGYFVADIFVDGLKRAGKDLTSDSLIKGLESVQGHKNPFGGSDVSYGPNHHTGASDVYLAMVEKGRWKTLERGLKP